MEKKERKGGEKKVQKDTGGERKTMHEPIHDSRFAKQHSDPRFQRVPIKKRKVIVDKRFSAMLDESSSFARKAVTDKYGRKVKHEMKEDLGRFYEIEEQDSEEDGMDEKADNIEGGNKKSQKGTKDVPGQRDKKGKTRKLMEDIPGADKISAQLRNQDLRTAMTNWASSSGSDDESEEEQERLEEERLLAEALDVSKPLVPVQGHVAQGEETRRLAVVNMDWERVKAIDLLMLLRSFAPSNGQVLSVKVYVSEFGKVRMEHERHFGPGAYLEDQDKQKRGKDSDDDDDESAEQEVDMIKLRKYEAEKLKYFYAIVECDSARTAMAIYDQCDGVEYEASSNVMDLRYVPDEEEFEDKPHAEASGEAPPDYVSPFFTNKALGHTKVELTWDKDDPERDVLKGKGLSGKSKKKKREAEMEAIDYTPFVASSDEEEEEDAGVRNQRDKARALLLQGGVDAFGGKQSKGRAADANEEQEEGDMQITFTPGLNAVGSALVKRKHEREKEEEMTVWEKYQKKKSDRKAESRKKNKRDDMVDDEEDLPEDSERVDDSFFADDPFFRLPEDDAEGDAEAEAKGVFKKKKGAKQAAAEEQKKKKEEARAEQEKKAEQLEALKKLMEDGSGAHKRGYELKHAALGRATERAGEEVRESKKNKKKKNKDRDGEEEDAAQQDTFKLDVDDPRFSSIYSNPKFALDPTDPNFRKTPGLSKLLEAGNKKRKTQPAHAAADDEEEEVKRPSSNGGNKKKDPALASLVSSLKARSWPKN